MTPFGEKMRSLRAERGLQLKDMAAGLGVSSAYLSALEHGRRIDYVFVGPPRQDGGGQVVGARVIGTGTRDGLPPSDHYGVLATLRY